MHRVALVVGVLALCLTAGAEAQRDQIRIVGSSTVYPFATKVAERFGRTSGFETPVVESTGSGGGLKLFCGGVGVEYPDIANSSRAIKASEIELCKKNGVDEIIEVKIGYDGIVLANSRRATRFGLTRAQIFLALAREIPMADGKLEPNRFETWKQIDPSLPEAPIEVLGPPPTSGTRDTFVELVMEGGCRQWDWIKALATSDKDRYQAICHSIREDGAFVEAGENDNLIVRKLVANPSALGIFGFSFLDQNLDRVQGSSVDGVEPTFENIADGAYPISRPLFFYVKKAHVGRIPGMEEYIRAFTSETAWGPDGYLSDAGLVPLPDGERRQMASNSQRLVLNVD